MTNASEVASLYSFCATPGSDACASGQYPAAAPVQASDGNFYGTASNGGANGWGTFFRLTPGGALTTLHSFGDPDAITVNTPPTQGADGSFYLASWASSVGFEKADGNGSIAKLSLGGSLTTLYFFCGGISGNNCPDGANPWGRLVQASDGNFYGTTEVGGANYSSCELGCGTVFRITPSGTFTQLYNFCSLANCADGSTPVGGLIQATDSNLYGTTSANAGDTGPGTIFSMTLSGELTVLHSGGTLTELVQGTDGSFYGTTSGGSGTVFKLDVGLGPFIRTVPTTGNVGTSVIILGNNLTGTTAVSFNGTAATFTVPSSTEILAPVPAGATSGTVQVTTPSGTLASNVPFVVAAPPTAPPNFSPPAGTYYDTAQAITISDFTPGAVIYYTTDGTTPTTSSTLYMGPLSIDVTQTLGAIALAPGYATSEVATAAYTFDFVPVARVSLATLTFAGIFVNTVSGAQAVTLSDPGSALLQLNGIAVSGDFAETNNCGNSLAEGASCTINVTFKPTTGGTRTGTLTITDDNDSTLWAAQTVSLSGVGQDFNFSTPSGSSSSQTVAPGQTATYTLSVGSSGGMTQTVSFTCTGAPSESTCTVSPNPASPGSNVTVTVTTTAPSVVVPRRFSPPLWPTYQFLLIVAALGLGLVGSVLARKRAATHRVAVLLPLAAGLLLALALASCGGGGGSTGPSNPGTPAGTYTITITGTSASGSGGLIHNTNLTLTVS